MRLFRDPAAADHPQVRDPDFWRRDLRLGRYDEIRARLDDPSYRMRQVAAWFRTRRVLRYIADRIDIPSVAAVSDLQRALADCGDDLLPYLLVGAFAANKSEAAVLDAAAVALPLAVVEACKDGNGRSDRLLLLLHLVDVAPEALAHVRGLHAWHRHGAANLVLSRRPARREGRFIEFVVGAAMENAIASVTCPAGVPPVHFEMAMPRGDDGVLVFLRRNLRRGHTWSNDGKCITHGHDEESIVLHFLDDVRRVRVSAQTADLPRQLADAIATAWFGQTCTFVEDLAPTEPACLRRLVAALVSRRVRDLRLVELAVRNAPLQGAPDLIVRTRDEGADIADAVAHFERTMGPLFERLHDILLLRVVFEDRRVDLDLEAINGRSAVRFSDGRLDRHAAARFRACVEREFGIQVSTMEAPSE